MSRKLTILLLSFAIVICLYLVCSISHILSIHWIRDYSLLPTIGKGSIHITSNLKKYTYNDIVYCSLPTSTPKHAMVFRRIAGLEGDTIEFNDGYLLRNGFMMDNTENIMFNYYIRSENVRDFNLFKKLKQKYKIKGDSIILSMNYAEFKEMDRHFVLKKIIGNDTRKDPGIFGSTNKNHWNKRNYGPIIVPKGQCFVVTDNRDNYPDSRHWGCIPLTSIKATVVRKK